MRSSLGWWTTTCALVVVIVALAGLLVRGARQPAARLYRSRRGWAGQREVRDLVQGRGSDRLVVGTVGGRDLALTARHSLLVVGPAHGGKTSGLSVPAIVEWDGPVVVATSKGHLIDETIGWRSRQGEVHVFDPAAVTRYHRSGWSVLAGCATWSGAIRTASDLTHAARAATAAGSADRAVFVGRSDLWCSSMATSLAPFLLAAAVGGRPIATVVAWIEREECDQVVAVLEGVDHAAAGAHRTVLARSDPDRAAYLHAMNQILAVYQDATVSPSTDRHEIVPDELLDGGSHTLYLTAPEHDQARFRPLGATVLRQVLAAAYEGSARLGGPLQAPLLVVLDDAVGVAPVDDLAGLASTAGARGIQVVSVFQDLAQIADHYGDRAGPVVRNHAAALVLPGRAGSGPGTLAAATATAAAADPAVVDAGGQALGGGGGSLLSRDLAVMLRPFEAALLFATPAPVRVRLRPWFRDAGLRRRVETPQDAIGPADKAPTHVAADRSDPLDQTAAWLQRTRRRRGAPRRARRDEPAIPLETDDRGYVAVCGRVRDEPPTNVTPLSDRFRR